MKSLLLIKNRATCQGLPSIQDISTVMTEKIGELRASGEANVQIDQKIQELEN